MLCFLCRLGQLCNLVGLSPKDLNSPTVASILQSHQPFEQTRPSVSTSYGMGHVHDTAGQAPTFQSSSVSASHTQGHGPTPHVLASVPVSHSTGTVKPVERTMTSNGTQLSVVETGHTVTGLATQDRDPGGMHDKHSESTRNTIHQEPRVIHSKPLVSPPEPSGTSHQQTSNNSNILSGVGGTTSSEVQVGVAINTPASIESSALYQASSTIGTQNHPPHASLLPPTLTQAVAPVSQAPIPQGETIPRTDSPRTQDLLTESKHTHSMATENDKQSSIPQQKVLHDDNGNMKDILFSKPKDISQGDSTSVIVGSVLSFTNPERPQLKTGAGDAKHLMKAQDDDEKDQKDVSKGSASEEDYEDDFLTSSDTGSNHTPQNISDKTSTPSKSSLSHRTYTRSSGSGYDHSDNDDIKSLGSSIHEDIGETPSPNRGRRNSSDESSDESF